MTWQIWIAGGLFSLGAQIMDACDQDLPLHVAEDYIANVCMLLYLGVAGYYWYESGYWVAAAHMTAALPGRIIRDVLRTSFDRSKSTSRQSKIAAFCLVAGPCLTMVGGFLTAGQLIAGFSELTH